MSVFDDKKSHKTFATQTTCQQQNTIIIIIISHSTIIITIIINKMMNWVMRINLDLLLWSHIRFKCDPLDHNHTQSQSTITTKMNNISIKTHTKLHAKS